MFRHTFRIAASFVTAALIMMLCGGVAQAQSGATVILEARIVDSNGQLVTSPAEEGSFRFDFSRTAISGAPSRTVDTRNGQGASEADLFLFPLINGQPSSNRLTITPSAPPSGFSFEKISCKARSGTPIPSGGFFSGPEAKDDLVPSFLLAGEGGYTCTADFTAELPPLEPPTVNIVMKSEGGDGVFAYRPISFQGNEQNVIGQRTLRTTGGKSDSTPIELPSPDEDRLRISIQQASLLANGFVGTSASCKDLANRDSSVETVEATNPFSGQLNALQLEFPLKRGSRYECTFSHRKVEARLNLFKETISGEGQFSFRLNGRLFPSSITEDGERIIGPQAAGPGTDSIDLGTTRISAGELTITQDANPAFSLDSIECTGGNPRDDVPNREVTLTIAGGDEIDCTFKSREAPLPPPTVTIVSVTEGGDATFNHLINGRDGDGTTVLLDDSVEIASGINNALSIPLPPNTENLVIAGIADSLRDNGFVGMSASCRDLNGRDLSISNVEPIVSAADVNALLLAFPLQRGAAYECTFSRRKVEARLDLFKETIGGDGRFSFTLNGRFFPDAIEVDAELTPTLETRSGASSPEGFRLSEGTLTITESASPDFRLDDIRCDGGKPQRDIANRKVTLTVTAGDDIDCTFVSREATLPPPTLTIVKEVVDANGNRVRGRDETFNFFVLRADNNELLASPSLETVGGRAETKPPLTLPTGQSLRISEGTVIGYTPFNFDCETKDGTPAPLVDFENIGSQDEIEVTFTPAAGGVYTCTFRNRTGGGVPLPAPTLTIVKEVVDANGNILKGRDGTFKFTLFSDNTPRLPVPLLTTVDGTAQLPTPLALTAGETWTIAENPQPGYTLVDIDCETLDDSPAPVVDFNPDLDNGEGGRSTFTPAPGGQYQCTFRNRFEVAPAQLTLTKETTGGDGTFSFSGSGATEFTQQLATSDGASASASVTVAEGELVITEAVADGFALAEISCTAGNPQVDIPNRKVSLTVAAGADIACTFTNRRTEAELTLIKETIGGDGTFTFTGSGSANFRESIRTNDGRSTPVTLVIDEGDLVITEDPAKGFALERASCAGAKTTFNAERRSVSLTAAGGARITCTFINREVAGRTATIIRKFLKRRAEQLTNDTGAPRLIERQRFAYGGSLKGGSLKDAFGATGSGSQAEGSLGYKTSLGRLNTDRTGEKAARLGVNPAEYDVSTGSKHRPGLDVWSEGSLSYFGVKDGNDDKTNSGRFGVLRLGADYLVSQKVLLGVLLQFDHLHEESELDATGYVISGRGWMAGPYFEAEVFDGVYFDAKALWGRSSNDISPFNTYTDTFSTTRHLLAARLKGSWHWKESERAAWHFSPEAEVVWFQEQSESYVDSNRVGIDGQRVRLGRFKFGPEVSYRHITNDGVRVEPHLGLKGLLSFGDAAGRDSLLSNGGVVEQAVDRFQVQFDGGVKVETPSGIRVDLRGSYTGLGKSENHTIGGKLNVTAPLPSRQSLK